MNIAIIAHDAKKEGFSDIAHLFELTAAIERSHERIYKSFVKNIKNNITDKSNIWNINTENDYHEKK